jgi:hypothetical protein
MVKRVLPFLTLATIVGYATASYIHEPRLRYLTRNESLTQRFVAVSSEQSLADLCYRLRAVHGVTGVSYRDYSESSHSAYVTVFFNPEQTSVRQLKIFMLQTRILWGQEMRV